MSDLRFEQAFASDKFDCADLLLAITLRSGPRATQAQTRVPVSAELQQQYDAAFQETLNKPADLDVLFRFAGLASQTGDLEGAISALERMLLINPDLPRVRLELGVLYYRLGSYEAARTYLETALKSPALPADVRGKAQEYLAEINSKAQPSHLSGEVFFGWRYQSNANLGPSTSQVLLFGQAANLESGGPWIVRLGRREFAGGSPQLRFRLNRGQIGARNPIHGLRQSPVSAVGSERVRLLDLTSGPRFQIFNGAFEDFSLKPFLTAGYVWVNDTSYYGSWGGGLESIVLLANGLRSITAFTFRRQNNQDTSYIPTNSQYRGNSLTANTALQYDFNPALMFFAIGNAQRFDADLAPWQSYSLWGVGGGFAFRFPDPFLKTNLQVDDQSIGNRAMVVL